jgi:hypothetical protein
MLQPAGHDGARGPGTSLGGGLAAREHERDLFPRAGLTILVAHADGSTTSLLTYPRNLSAGGVSFLSGVALPEGTRCAVQFVTESGRRVVVPGSVRWSTPVVGRIRRVGMAFDQSLDAASLARLLA